MDILTQDYGRFSIARKGLASGHNDGATGFPRRIAAFSSKIEFVEAFQSDFICPAPAEKIFHFSCRANHLYKPARPVSHEGRLAIVTDVENRMRWTLAARKTNAREADGEVVWA